MNSIAISGDTITLHWDGVRPAGCSERVEPEDVPFFWEHLRGIARWSKWKGCFLLAFSKQNIKRLHAQFGPIPIRSGATLFHELKQKHEKLYGLAEKARKIKSLPLDQLPVYDYKVPPRGEYQHRGVIYLKNLPFVPLHADCGAGKTYMVLVSTEQQIRAQLLNKGKTLICGKLNTLWTGWESDCAKFTNLTSSVLWVPQTGDKLKRHAAIRERLAADADVYFINHDGVRVFEDLLVDKNFEKVVVDESTILKGFHGEHHAIKGGAFGKALMNVARKAKYRVTMSGTPASNGPIDLWGQFAFLDPDGLILEPRFNDFRNAYYNENILGRKDKEGRPIDKKGNLILRRGPKTPVKWDLKPGATDQIARLIDPFQYRVKLRDVAKDLPPLTKIIRKCPMTKEQARHYESMKKHLKVEINEKRIVASVALSQLMKLRQITGGFIMDQEQKPHALPNNGKLELMDQLIEEEIASDEKIIVFAEYQWEIRTLAERYGFLTAYGGNTTKKNLENLDAFMKNPEVRGIVMQPQSTAHGITLTMAHYMIFYSISASAEFNYQAVKRIERTGQKSAMFVYYLLCEKSFDETMYRTIVDKNEEQQELIDRELLANWDK